MVDQIIQKIKKIMNKWAEKGDQDPGRIHQKGVTEKDTKNDDNQIYLPTPFPLVAEVSDRPPLHPQGELNGNPPATLREKQWTDLYVYIHIYIY